MLGSALHSAVSGISAAQYAISITADNITNLETDGFKSSRARLEDQSPFGVRADGVDTDFSPGSMLPSRNALDLAIDGHGFFVLEATNGERLYTRDGNFQFNAAGELVTSSGLRVLGLSSDGNDLTGAVRISQDLENSSAAPTDIVVGASGDVSISYGVGSSAELGRLQVVRFPNPNGLVRRGQNTFSVGNNSGQPTPAGTSTRILSGVRESSNTDLVTEIVSLSRFSTMFRANLLVLETSNAMFESLLSLGRR